MTDEEVKLASAVERLRTCAEMTDEVEGGSPDSTSVGTRDLRAVLRALDERTAERDEARAATKIGAEMLREAVNSEERAEQALAAREASVASLRSVLATYCVCVGNGFAPRGGFDCAKFPCKAGAALSETPDLAALREFGEQCFTAGAVGGYSVPLNRARVAAEVARVLREGGGE